ncbi:hypothetical protein BC830DRAFT_1163124 [Chytriomyces sp. MP71]|nr:hypothetical protein BC830DRAFT_1163124 [Chytriomyces sp. MP71]
MPAHLRKALLKKRNGHWRKAAGTGSPRDAGEDSHAQEYAESAEPAIPEEVIQHHLTRELTVLAAIHESNLQACAVARAAAHAYAERVFQGARKSAEDSYLTGRARARALVNEDVCVRVARLRGERVRWEVKSLDTVYKVPSECAPPTASVVVDKMSIATLCDALPEDCVENDIAYIRMMTS